MGREDRRGRKCEGKGREAEIKTKLNLTERQECSRKRRGGCIVSAGGENPKDTVVEEGVE